MLSWIRWWGTNFHYSSHGAVSWSSARCSQEPHTAPNWVCHVSKAPLAFIKGPVQNDWNQEALRSHSDWWMCITLAWRHFCPFYQGFMSRLTNNCLTQPFPARSIKFLDHQFKNDSTLVKVGSNQPEFDVNKRVDDTLKLMTHGLSIRHAPPAQVDPSHP